MKSICEQFKIATIGVAKWLGKKAAKVAANRTLQSVVLASFLVCASTVCANASPHRTPAMNNGAAPLAIHANNAPEKPSKLNEQTPPPRRSDHASDEAYYKAAKEYKVYWVAIKAGLEKSASGKRSQATERNLQGLENLTQAQWIERYRANTKKQPQANKVLENYNKTAHREIDKIIAKQLYKTVIQEVYRNKHKGCSHFARDVTRATMQELNKQAGTNLYDMKKIEQLLEGAAAFQFKKITDEAGGGVSQQDIWAGKVRPGTLIFVKRCKVPGRVARYPNNISHVEMVIEGVSDEGVVELCLAGSDVDRGARIVPLRKWLNNTKNDNGQWAVAELYGAEPFRLANADKMAQLKSNNSSPKPYAKIASAQMGARYLPQTASPSSAAQTSTADSYLSRELKRIAAASRNNKLNELSSAKKTGSVRVAYNPPMTLN